MIFSKKISTLIVVAIATTLATQPAFARGKRGGGHRHSHGGYATHTKAISSGNPTAKCRDGAFSYSASRRGACSRHGGVESWLQQ